MHNPASEAVLFFNDGKVVKEMLYAEFEAVLDDVVGIQEFAGRDCCAVYVKINPQLKVLAAVFFTIDFTSEGKVDSSWNLPLAHLSEICGKGPDMGAGVIRLTCRSQCPIPWHQRNMWDPNMSADSNSFVALRATVARNRLGLVVEEIPVQAVAIEPPLLQPVSSKPRASEGGRTSTQLESGVQADFAKKERLKAARLIKRLRLQIATQDTRRKDEESAASIEHATEIETYQKKLKQLQKSLKAEKNSCEKLKEKFSEQEAEFQLISEQFLDQVDEAKALEKSQLGALARKFELELNNKVESESAQLKEMLDMREVELHYRDEQISSLRDEVAQLRQEKQRMLTEGGDKFLEKLGGSGITFVAYHPGSGHLTIPVAEAGQYLDSPTQYVAQKLFVTEERYLEWLVHYQSPVCAHHDGNSQCGKTIDRVDGPGHFIAGKSDRCTQHIVTAASYDEVAFKIS